jgi:quercetin dioxygenase-like cupin family protein
VPRPFRSVVSLRFGGSRRQRGVQLSGTAGWSATKSRSTLWTRQRTSKETTVTLGGGYMLPSREGHKIAAIGIGITMKTDGKSTHDAYSMFEYVVPPQTSGPPPHVHTREDESFVCIAGQLSVMLGGENFVIGHGDYLLLPRDVVHTFRNATDEEARVISVVSPAGLERYYEALAELPPGPPDIEAIKLIMADYGLELRIPPKAG